MNSTSGQEEMTFCNRTFWFPNHRTYLLLLVIELKRSVKTPFVPRHSQNGKNVKIGYVISVSHHNEPLLYPHHSYTVGNQDN